MKAILTILTALMGLFFSSCDVEDSIPQVNATNTITAPDGRDTKFTAEELALPTKKGACFTLRDPATAGNKSNWNDGISKVISLNVGWNYSWGASYVPVQPEGIEFVPMMWGGGGDPYTFTANIRTMISENKCKRILGFNEPDGKKQANMSVEKAVSLWPYLESLNIPLGSPATVDAENGEWLKDFMSEVDRLGLRVDYICVHNYGGGNASVFENKLKNIYNKYKRPLLITEFAVADWNAKTPAENKHSKAQVLNFMKTVLPWMEEQDFVLGYCWFSFGQTSPQGTSSALFDIDGNLTELGKYYSAFPDSVTPDPDPDPTPEEKNLVLNPGFENKKENWTGQWNINFDTKEAQEANIITGDITLRFSGKKAWADISQSVAVEEGHTYKVGMTGRIQDGVGPSGTSSTNRILYFIVRKPGDKDTVYASANITKGEDTIIKEEFTVKGYNEVQIYISKGSGIAYVDDVYLIDITK